jgi:hypothetical protein
MRGKTRVKMPGKFPRNKAVNVAANSSKFFPANLVSNITANCAGKLAVMMRQPCGKSPGKFDATF